MGPHTTTLLRPADRSSPCDAVLGRDCVLEWGAAPKPTYSHIVGMRTIVLCAFVSMGAGVPTPLPVMNSQTRHSVMLRLDQAFADRVLVAGSRERGQIERSVFSSVAHVGVASHIGVERVAASDTARARKLQSGSRPGVDVQFSYTIHCGATCDDQAIPQMHPETSQGQQEAVDLANNIIASVAATAHSIGFTNSVILSDAGSVAMSVERPNTAVIARPTNYRPDVDCLGTWTPCTSACLPSVFHIHTPAGPSGAACPFADGTTVQCRPGDGQCTYDYDCVGAWSTCQDPGRLPNGHGIPCSDKVYTIALALSGNGQDCPTASGATLPCAPGEDACPADIDCEGTWDTCSGNTPSGVCPDKHFHASVEVSGMGQQCQNAVTQHIISGRTVGVYQTRRPCHPGEGQCTCVTNNIGVHCSLPSGPGLCTMVVPNNTAATSSNHRTINTAGTNFHTTNVPTCVAVGGGR